MPKHNSTQPIRGILSQSPHLLRLPPRSRQRHRPARAAPWPCALVWPVAASSHSPRAAAASLRPRPPPAWSTKCTHRRWLIYDADLHSVRPLWPEQLSRFLPRCCCLSGGDAARPRLLLTTARESTPRSTRRAARRQVGRRFARPPRVRGQAHRCGFVAPVRLAGPEAHQANGRKRRPAAWRGREPVERAGVREGGFGTNL